MSLSTLSLGAYPSKPVDYKRILSAFLKKYDPKLLEKNGEERDVMLQQYKGKVCCCSSIGQIIPFSSLHSQ